MPHHWCSTTAAAALAITIVWHRRHTLPLPHYGHTTKALAAYGLGLLLIGPPGEPIDLVLQDWTGIHNLEDLAGHSLLIIGAYYIARRALITAHGNFQHHHVAHVAATAILLLLVAHLVTGAGNAPSSWQTPADSRAYWVVALAAIAPTMIYAAYSNSLVVRCDQLPRRQRLLGAAHTATYSIGALSCAARPIPAIPASWTYHGLAITLTGMSLVAWIVWRHVTADIRHIDQLVA